MERVASHYHLPVVDIGKTITDKIQKGELTWEEYGLDYVHPTPLGHEIITSELLNLFQEKEQKEKCDGRLLSGNPRIFRSIPKFLYYGFV